MSTNVTYRWRATGPHVRRVYLIGAPRWSSDDRPFPLTREGDTDVWSATFEVRDDLRHRYGFVEASDDRPLGFREALPGLRVDPANPSVFPDDTADDAVPAPPDGVWLPASVLALDNAPAQPWIRRSPGVAAGTLTADEFRSELLGNTRRVWTYLPPGYDPERTYGLLLMADGWEWAALTPLAPILDNLIAAGLIPPLVAVLHECPPGRRNTELACDPTHADALVTELLPWVAARASVTDDPRQRIVAGQSYGGLHAAFLALRHPDAFGAVLSQSGAFWYDDHRLLDDYANAPRHPLRFALDVGLLEGDMVDTNRRFADVLTAKGHDVTYREVNSEHSWLSWRGTLTESLIELTNSWAPAERSSESPSPGRR